MTETVRFSVSGMTCVSCVGRVTRALKHVDGVTSVKVDLGRETATVVCAASVPEAALVAAVSAAGYEAGRASVVVVDEPARRPLLTVLAEVGKWRPSR